MSIRVLSTAMLFTFSAGMATAQQPNLPVYQPVVQPVQRATRQASTTMPPVTSNNVGRNYLEQEYQPAPAVTNFGDATSSCGCGSVGCDAAGCGSSTCDSCDCGSSCSGGCGKYRRVFGGVNYLDDFTPEGATAPPLAGGIPFEDGWALGASRGRYINCNLRHEMEVVFRNNSAGDFDRNGPNANFDLSGNINCISTQQVLLWDLNRLQFGGARPYVGASAGGSYVDADLNFGGGLAGHISDAAFAYQGIAGVERQINQQVAGFIEYRYFRTAELELEYLGADYDVNYIAQNIFFGLRITR